MFFYLAKLTLKPVDRHRDRFSGGRSTGLLRKRSRAVTCQPSHRFSAVTAEMSKFIRYSPVFDRLVKKRKDSVTLVTAENLCWKSLANWLQRSSGAGG